MGVAVLAIIVLIRTFLSFTLEVGLEGKWPRRRAAKAEGPSVSPEEQELEESSPTDARGLTSARMLPPRA